MSRKEVAEVGIRGIRLSEKTSPRVREMWRQLSEWSIANLTCSSCACAVEMSASFENEAFSLLVKVLDIFPSSEVSLRSLSRSFSRDLAISSCKVLLAVSAEDGTRSVS